MTSKFRFAAVLAMAAAFALSLAWAPAAQAATQTELEAKIKMMEETLQSMKQQLSQVQQTQNQQEVVLAEKAATDSLPKWVQRMSFYGDTRFRYENTSYDDFNGKSKDSRSRFRVRLRFGVKSQIHEDVEMGLRMATGSDDDPTSTNQTMGNYWGEITSWGIDTIYVKWTPSFVPGKGLSFTFGKAKNPFVTSKVIWDGDVVPEGAFLKYKFNKEGNFQPFVLGTWLYLKEHSSDPPDDLYGWAGQAGFDWKIGKTKLTAATSYYDWGKLGEAEQVPPNVHGNPIYTENGEDRLSTFKVWDLIAKAQFKFSDKGAVDFWGHYLTNTDATGPEKDKDSAWGAGAKLSYSKFFFGAWYKYVEANATPGFIADSDSGFVNKQGLVLQAGWKFMKNGKLTFSYFNMENVDDNIDGASNNYQTFFTDVVFKF